MRGNPSAGGPEKPETGSIPAGAGEPGRADWPGDARRVYPRRCGGTDTVGEVGSAARGLSPQVRGNPRLGREVAPGRGSIPAGAGEPIQSRSRGRPRTVYPRRCGGTPPMEGVLWREHGLSPQVRGNPRDPVAPLGAGGSIPAGAGEPEALSGPSELRGVYPRRCGGTDLCGRREKDEAGLSPQVRGNHRETVTTLRAEGSIPAGAGEPRGRARPCG